jgi:hypothetical protein
MAMKSCPMAHFKNLSALTSFGEPTMKRLLALLACLSLMLSGTAFAAPVNDHPLPGGFLNIDYFAGPANGANTAYFITDFGGNGGSPHGFGFRWNGTETADNAMFAIDAAGALDITTSNFGSAQQPNYFINRMTDLPDNDLPDFSVDSRFWHFWTGTYSASNVAWTESQVGISGRDFLTGDIISTLTNGGFYGFYASNDPVAPRLPIAVPEPAALLLALLGSAGFALARRRKLKALAQSARFSDLCPLAGLIIDVRSGRGVNRAARPTRSHKPIAAVSKQI